MGMSTHVVGFREPDEKWNKMKAVWEVCVSSGVPVPEEVLEFFNEEPPGDKPGMEIDLGWNPDNYVEAVREYCADARSGFEVDVRKLPKDLHIIRFYNAW